MKCITYPLNNEATEFYLWKEQGQTICVTYLLKKNTLYKITYNIFTSLCHSHHAMSLTPPVSMTSLSLQSRCHLHRWVCNPGVNDIAESAIPVSMTPLSLQSQCQWHHWVCNPGVNDTAESAIPVSMTTLSLTSGVITRRFLHVRISPRNQNPI